MDVDIHDIYDDMREDEMDLMVLGSVDVHA
jgi:hypothetical protein